MGDFDTEGASSGRGYTVGVVAKLKGYFVASITGIKIHMSIGVGTTKGRDRSLVADRKGVGQAPTSLTYVNTSGQIEPTHQKLTH